MYFYAILLEDFIIELDWEDLDISEIGCYYYQKGVLSVERIDLELKKEIRNKINSALEIIRREELVLQDRSCDKCNLKVICDIEKMRRK